MSDCLCIKKDFGIEMWDRKSEEFFICKVEEF